MSSEPQSGFQDSIVRDHHHLPGQQVRLNDADDAEVREVERNGREYLVFPIIPAREMVLDYPEYGTKELLSSQRLRESAEMWAGTPLTFIHPENPQRTADLPEEYTKTVIGQAYNPQLVDGEKLRVQAWVDVDKAMDIGGLAKDVVDLLKDGEDVSVSAGYATLDDDKSGGRHNGQQYDIEQGYLIPDHIAVFPSDEFQARCSWEDGCGAPRVNTTNDPRQHLGSCNTGPDGGCSDGACSCGFHANARETARTPTYDGLTSVEWEPPTFTEYIEEYYSRQETDAPDDISVDSVSQDSLSFAAERTLVGTADDPDSAGQVRSYPVVNLDDELNEDALTSARLLAHNSPAEDSIRSVAAELLERHDWPSGETYDFSNETNYAGQTPIQTDGTDRFEDKEDAMARAIELGCDDTHSHPHRYKDDETIHMPCETHAEYEKLLKEKRENIGGPSGDLRYVRAGEYVQWDTDDGVLKGRVSALTRSGCLTTLDASKCAEDETEVITSVEVYDEGMPTGERVLKRARDGEPNEDNLRSWDAPRMSREQPDRPRVMNQVDESDMLSFDEGEMVRLQPFPSITGRIDHIPDNQSGDVTIAMVDLYDSGEHTISVGVGSLMPMDRMNTRTNAVTVDIGDTEVDLTPPEAVVNAAEAGLQAKTEDYADQLGDCGTGVGEQRANQIIDGDLAPEDFLTRENGTPIPTYLDSHSEDAPSTDQTPTDWGEEIWTDGCGPVQYTLWGGTGTGTGLNWADGVKDDLEAAIEAAEDFTLNAHIVTMDNDEPITTDDLSLRHNVAPFLADIWGTDDVGLVESFSNALDPSKPEGTQAFAATVAHNYEGLDAVDVQTALAAAEERDTATIDLNYDAPDVEIDGGVGPHADRLNARSHITPFLAEKWDTDPSEAMAVINALDPDHPDDFSVLVNVFPREIESDTETVVNAIESEIRESETITNATPNTNGADPETLFGKFLKSMGWSPDNQTHNTTPTTNADETDESADTDTSTSDETNQTDMKVNMLSEGDTVQWDWSNGTAYGRVKEIVEDGTRTVSGNERSVSADDNAMIAVLQQMNEDGEAMDQEVLKYIYEDEENENNLRSWDAPSTNMVDFSMPDNHAVEPVSEGDNTETNTNTTNDTQNSITMDMTINELASNSAFGVSDLNGWSDEELAALEATVNDTTTNDMHGDGSSGEDEDEEEDEEDEEDEESMNENAKDEEISSLKSEVNELKAMVEDVANQKANAEKEQQAKIVANAIKGMDKEAALELSSEKLEELADAHANNVNFGAVPGEMDRSARVNSQQQTDVDEYPAGGRSAWKERKQSSGGD